MGDEGAARDRRLHRAPRRAGLGLWLSRAGAGAGRGDRQRAQGDQPRLPRDRRDRAASRPLVDARPDRQGRGVTIYSVSGYSGGGKSMIEAYESGRAPSFELYGLALEHKHMPEIAALLRARGAADLRPLGRQFPPGHAGERSAASGCAAGQADRRRPARGARRALRRARLRQGRRAPRRPPPRCGSSPSRSTAPTTWRSMSTPTRRGGRRCWSPKFDNLGKGASGAAVQNLELMLGL